MFPVSFRVGKKSLLALFNRSTLRFQGRQRRTHVRAAHDRLGRDRDRGALGRDGNRGFFAEIQFVDGIAVSRAIAFRYS